MRCVPVGIVKRALNLPPKSLTLVLKLLLLTQSESNTVTLSKNELMELTGDTLWDTARMKLTPIRQANLAHVTTNEHVYVTWLDANGNLHDPFPCEDFLSPVRRNLISDDKKTSHPRVEILSGNESSRDKLEECEEILSPARRNLRVDDKKSSQVGALLVSSNNNNKEQVEHSIKLLTAVGMPEADARRYAEANQYEWLERQAFSYWRELQSEKVHSVRALYTRIDRKFRAAPLADEDRQSELYAKIYGEAETEGQRESRLSEERRSKYIPEGFEDIIRR